jgi:penicillin-binding protein 1B
LPQPENIEQAWIDPATGLRADSTCRDAQELPFIRDSVPEESAPCASRSPVRAVKGWFKRLFKE